jgi:hypothetical protein
MKIFKTASYKKIAETFMPGEMAYISDGSGVDSGKIVRIVSPKEVKTDGRGVPTNIEGAYQPVDWSKEVAFRDDDDMVGTMFKNRLRKMTDAEHESEYGESTGSRYDDGTNYLWDDPARHR